MAEREPLTLRMGWPSALVLALLAAGCAELRTVPADCQPGAACATDTGSVPDVADVGDTGGGGDLGDLGGDTVPSDDAGDANDGEDPGVDSPGDSDVPPDSPPDNPPDNPGDESGDPPAELGPDADATLCEPGTRGVCAGEGSFLQCNDDGSAYFLAPCPPGAPLCAPDNERCVDDLDPPGPTSGLDATIVGADVHLTWFNPNVGDLAQVVVVRYEGTAVSGAPVWGATYGVGASLGSGTVIHSALTTAAVDLGRPCDEATYRTLTRDDTGNWGEDETISIGPDHFLAPVTNFVAEQVGPVVQLSWSPPAGDSDQWYTTLVRSPTFDIDDTLVICEACDNPTEDVPPSGNWRYRALRCNRCGACETVGVTDTVVFDAYPFIETFPPAPFPGGTTEATIVLQFNEPVKGVDLESITVDGGALAWGLETTDRVLWSFTLQPLRNGITFYVNFGAGIFDDVGHPMTPTQWPIVVAASNVPPNNDCDGSTDETDEEASCLPCAPY